MSKMNYIADCSLVSASVCVSDCAAVSVYVSAYLSAPQSMQQSTTNSCAVAGFGCVFLPNTDSKTYTTTNLINLGVIF